MKINTKFKYLWGYLLFSLGVNSKANEIFSAIDNNSDWELKLLLARINLSMNKMNKSLKYIDEAIMLVNDESKKYIIIEEKINILINLHRYNEALDILKRLNQEDVSILAVIANIYMIKSEWDLAEKYAKKIVEIEPINEDALYICAIVCYEKERFNDTIKYCKKILSQNYNKEEDALGFLVNSYIELNDLVKAEKYFRKLRNKYSGHLTTIFIHAKFEFKKGNIKKTHKILEFIKTQNKDLKEDFNDLYNQVKKEINYDGG